MSGGLGGTHAAVIGAYLAGLVAIGLRTAGRQRTTAEYFLAGRRLPWLPVAMSMFASVTSAVTFMGVPAQAASGNLSLLLVGAVSLLAAPVLAKLMYPAYRRAGVSTSYEFLESRFGRPARVFAAALFVAARVSWLGLVVYAPALALSTATKMPLGWAIGLIGLVATAYTALGGLAAVVWTDVLQFAVMAGGGVWIAAALLADPAVGAAAWAAEVRSLLPLSASDWTLNPMRMNAAAVVIAYAFILLHEYGVDQVTVQRLLAVSSARGVGRAIAFNAATDAWMISLLLLVGVGLRLHAAASGMEGPADAMLARFAIERMPAVAGGLLLAAVFAAAMSSMDSGLNSVVAVMMSDFVRPAAAGGEERRLRWARALTVALGAAATLAATQIARIGDMVRAFYTFTGMFSGPVLALFVLALAGRRRRPGELAAWAVSACAAVTLTATLTRRGLCHEIYLFPIGFGASFLPALAAGWIAEGLGRRRGGPQDPDTPPRGISDERVPVVASRRDR